MSRNRIPALDEARRYLFTAQEGLTKAGSLLAENGMAADGRSASHMGREVEEMKKRVRKAHEDAIAAERGNGGKKSGGGGAGEYLRPAGRRHAR